MEPIKMQSIDQIRQILVALRMDAGISQADLAKRLMGPSASRISRLESGDLSLSIEEAEHIASAIGDSLPRAKEFANYLSEDWKIIDRPAFNHISLATLRKAEGALQQLAALEEDPDIKNAFLQQIRSCKQALERAVAFVLSTEHSIAFVGSPGVGKTTGICALGDLRDPAEKDLGRQMALQTGAGRTTVCEVHVRNGNGYSLSVDPCSEDELYHHISEFCDYLISLAGGRRDNADGPGISSEVQRALRNMTGLTVKRTKDADGKTRSEDPALDLVREYSSKEDLQVQIRLRLDSDRRNRTSVSLPRDSTVSGLVWLSKTFGDINYGKHPEFSLPRRIEVTVPTPVLGTTELDVRLIDTRGVDEPSAPRRDLQTYLDDERTLIVLCSGFKDAPDAAMQAVIERAAEGGLHSAMEYRAMLLVLPQDGEESAVRDNMTGDPVSSSEEGRDIRREQVGMTLGHLGVGELDIQFMNVRSDDDRENVLQTLVNQLKRMRQRVEVQIDNLVGIVTRLIKNRANEEMRATFQAATRSLRTWFAKNCTLQPNLLRDLAPEESLLDSMNAIRHVGYLRGSVNRRGTGPNFDFWHGLGWGTRRETVARTAEQITVLRGLVTTALDDSELADAHDFLTHFLSQIDASTATFHQEVQSVGETAFFEQLREDHGYWTRCQNRWGTGPGYRVDIHDWTDDWFDHSTRAERYKFVENEIQRRWCDAMRKLDTQLASAAVSDEVAA